jgi:hypothetical protein
MQVYNRKFILKTMPDIFLRGEHVQAMIKNDQGKFVMGAKNLYPRGIVRFVGGGLDEASPVAGIVREVEEELLIKVPANEFIHLAQINCQIKHIQDIVFTAHLFFVKISQEVTPNDDLDGITMLDEKGFESLIENYRYLTDSTLPDHGWSWADYGQIFAEIHQIGLDEVRKLGL